MYASHLRLATVLVFALCGISSAQSLNGTDAYRVAYDHYKNARWELAEQELTQFLKQQPNHSESPAASFLLAECRMQQNDFDSANASFQQFLLENPQHRYAKHAAFRAGEAAYLAGHYEAARKQLLLFKAKYPVDSLNEYVLNYVGDIGLAAGDGNTAHESFREALRSFPAGTLREANHFGLARSLELLKQPIAAQREYRQIIHSNGPLATDAQVQLGISLYSNGNYDEAAAEFQRAVATAADGSRSMQARYWLGTTQLAQRRLPEAEATLKVMLQQQPDHALTPELTYRFAEFCRQAGQAATAAKYYDRILKQWPESQWADDCIVAVIEQALNDGEFDRVKEMCSAFAKRDLVSPLMARVMQLDGRALLKQQRYDDAIKQLQLAIQQTIASDGDEAGAPVISRERFTDQQTSWYYLAIAHLAKNDLDATLDALRHIDLQTASVELQNGVQIARASALVAAGRYADAIGPLETYLAANQDGPDAVQCQHQLIIALAGSGDLDRAYQRLIALPDEQRTAIYWQAVHAVAEAAYKAEQYDTAEAVFQLLTVESAPDDFVAKGWSGLGWTAYQRGNYAAATDAFARLLADFPECELTAEARMMQTRSLARQGKSDEALNGYLTLAAADKGSVQAASALLEAARLHEAAGDKKAALAVIEGLTRDYPSFPQRDAAIYQQAWLLTDLKRSTEADQLFELLHSEFPDSRYWADCTYRLAEHALRAGQYSRVDKLIRALITASNVTPELLSHSLYLQGQLAASTERWDQVSPPLQRLLNDFAESPLRLPAEYWIAEAQFQLGDFEQASIAFDRLAEQIGDQPANWQAMIPLRRAQIRLKQNREPEALEVASEISERFPGFRQQYEVDYVIGRVLATQGKLTQARAAYERVIRSPQGGQTETAAMAQWMIGEAFMHQKNYAEATRAFHRVDSLFAYPRWQAAALLQAGKCYELQGRSNEAARAFTRLVEKFPETEFAKEASQRLQQLGPQQIQTARH